MLLLGWLFYIAFPMAAGLAGWLDDVPHAAPYADYFTADSPWWPALLLYSGLIPLAFAAGSKVSRTLALPIVPHVRVDKISWAMLPLYCGLMTAFALSAREFLFQGYLGGVDSSVVGPLATMEMLLLFQFIVCKSAGLRMLTVGFGAMLGVCSILLLGMGGRLYVLTALVAVYFYWWNWVAKSARARLGSLGVSLLLVIAMVAVGMYRVGGADRDEFAFYVLAEPMYTGISGLSLVLNGSWSLIDTPKDLFSGFINLVPAAVWPGKSEYFVSLLDTSLDLESPFGGLSIIASTVGNFGLLGGLAFIGFVGAVLGWSSKNHGSALGRALYCVLVAMLPFMFFRDPFQVQIKVVLTAFALVGIHLLISPRVRRRRLVSVAA